MDKNRIFLLKIDPSLSQDAYHYLLQLISEEKRARCLQFQFRQDALRVLYGELMIRYLICRQFSCDNKEISFYQNEEGKPYVKNLPIYFNLSHSGDFVVCAISEQEVGVDIEQIKPIDLQLAKRYFHANECKDLFAQKEADRLNYFFSLWTLKESYLKWHGEKMATPLHSFSFHITDAHITVTDPTQTQKPQFKQFSLDGYKLSLCTTVDDFPDRIEEITPEEIYYGITNSAFIVP